MKKRGPNRLQKPTRNLTTVQSLYLEQEERQKDGGLETNFGKISIDSNRGNPAILESIRLFPSLMGDENGDECYGWRNIIRKSDEVYI